MSNAPARQDLAPDTPLRLAQAAALAFPNGGMSAKSLRLEAQRGRLVIERIAGKDYTTLAAIEEMRKLCRVAPKAPASTYALQTTPNNSARSGSSGTASGSVRLDAALMTLEALKKPSPATSQKSTTRQKNDAAQVVRLSPGSRT